MLAPLACCLTISLTLLVEVSGHGRLVDPPARSSMWRFGFDTPENHDDMALYCGGFQRQWERNGGRCGVCGDPFDGPRDHEAGGKYATGIIAKRYRQGQSIEISVELTKSHLGWFEFRLCPHNNPNRRVSQQCLDRNLLRLQADGSTRYQITSWASQVHTISLRLPPGVVCSQCVLQWRYNTGNSWGCDDTGCCIGCGRQEQFYGCADVAISGSGSQGYPSLLSSVSEIAGHNTGSKPTFLGGAETEESGSPSGGFLPININTNTNTNTNSNSGYIPGQSGSPGLSDVMLCHGIVQVYTQWCRKNCLAGNCSVWLCSMECFRLLG